MHEYVININVPDRPLATYIVWDYNRHDAGLLARRVAEVLATLPLPSPTTEEAVVTVVRADTREPPE